MALTVEQLGRHLRIVGSSLGNIPQSQVLVLRELLEYCETEVNSVAPGAPETVKDRATIQLAGYINDQPDAPAGSGYANALRNSGATSVLSRYIVRRAVSIGPDGPGDVTAAATATPAPAPGTPAPAPGTPGTPGLDTIAINALIAAAIATALAGIKHIDQTARDDAAAAAAGAAAAKAAADAAASNTVAVTTSLRLPSTTTAMRLGWKETQVYSVDLFTRADNHPADGAAVGTTFAGIFPPPFPAALAAETSLYLFIWIAATPGKISDIGPSGIGALPLSAGVAQAVDGVDGTLFVSRLKLPTRTSSLLISAFVNGDLIASQPWTTAAISAAAAGGAPGTVVFKGEWDAATNDPAEVGSIVSVSGSNTTTTKLFIRHRAGATGRNVAGATRWLLIGSRD